MIEFIEYFLFMMLHRGARLLSFRSAGRIGALLGTAAYRLTGFRKDITAGNLAKALPELTDHQREEIALGAYRNYGIAVMEMLWAGGASEGALRKTVRLRNPDVLMRAVARGRGLILLSGHFGSWELLISGMRLQVGLPFTMIVQHQRNGRIDALIDRNRRRFDNVTVPMGPSVREVLKALQAGRIVAILGDQSGPKESVFVQLFGRPSATHRGAAAFSLRTGAPIVMGFLLRQDDGTYEAVFEEVGQSDLKSYSEENILELTRRHTAVLEKYIRQRPDHWLWMHKRWKHTGYYESLTEVAAEEHGR